MRTGPMRTGPVKVGPVQTPVQTNSAKAAPLTTAQAHAAVQWLADLAMRKMPPTYRGDKGWGDTKEIWAGVKVRFEGGETKNASAPIAP